MDEIVEVPTLESTGSKFNLKEEVTKATIAAVIGLIITGVGTVALTRWTERQKAKAEAAKNQNEPES